MKSEPDGSKRCSAFLLHAFKRAASATPEDSNEGRLLECAENSDGLSARILRPPSWAKLRGGPRYRAAQTLRELFLRGSLEGHSENLSGNYPLTRNYYENNSLRIIFRNFQAVLYRQNLRERRTFSRNYA